MYALPIVFLVAGIGALDDGGRHGLDLRGARIVASSTTDGSEAAGPLDDRRFDTSCGSLWKGRAGDGPWSWAILFDEPRPVGAILQIVGDDSEVAHDVPRDYVWQATEDGFTWHDLGETRRAADRRMFRVFRLARARTVRGLRLRVDATCGDAPALRSVELFEDADAPIPFPEWIAAVSTVEESDSLHEASPFVALARDCPDWGSVPAQRIWMGDVDADFAAAEPAPLCAFLTGNYNDWCQKDRAYWKGIEAILERGDVPIWASCGGAQGLAILAESGTDAPWDCPRCRDPEHPRLPIYTHIGHTGPSPCGQYERNIAERGPTKLRIRASDPVLEGLPDVFEAMESHVGQIAYPPRGWSLLVIDGPGAKTRQQLLRAGDRPIYAAQFHIEMAGTPESSRQIMANFLDLARRYRDAQRRGAGPGCAVP
jgi:hypothetical protein